jgi:hypothetical protein
MVALKDGDLHYYQHLRAAPLARGRWTELDLDLSSVSRDWQPHGHFKPWDGYCRQDANQLSVKFTSDAAYEGALLVDSVALHTRPDAEPAKNAVYNLRTNSTVVGRYEKFEISFNLARTYSNPFDPNVVDVTGHFVCPDGTTETALGFFYQGYQRRRQAGAETLIPMGRSQWKMRYAPRQVGRYYYCVTVDDGATIRTDTATFLCVDSDSHGYVRMSKRDPDYFEFDDGTFYYPIGHNIAAVRDTRAEQMGVYISDDEGTYAYDRLLSRMGACGENFGRVWMVPWSFEIEWTKDYASHYCGVGRYSLHNAWRLDHVVETAAKNGVYLMLLLASHGEITNYESNFYGSADRTGRIIPEWGTPYWQRNGGPISSPDEFYTNPELLRLYKRQVRYIAARWGYSTAIMCWEFLNEPDLHPPFHPDKPKRFEYGKNCARFVRELILHMHQSDPAHHLATTGLWQHLATHTAPVMQLAEMDFFAGHVFQTPLPRRLRDQYNQIKARYGKVMFVTEADFSPFPRAPEVALRSLRVPVWSSFMMPHPGTACPWWWVLIDQKDAYGMLGAVAAFARGEDRRGQNYRSIPATVTDTAPERGVRRLAIEALGNNRRAFCWVYNTVAFSEQSSWITEVPASATVRMPGLDDGPYIVEVWDTSKGAVVHSLPVQSAGRIVTFQLPPFVQDVACKVICAAEEPVGSAPPATPDETPSPTHTIPDA